MTTDYLRVFTEFMRRRAELTRQRDQTEVELARLKQSILDVFQLLPEDQQKSYQKAIDDMEGEGSSLLGAIKLVFSTHKREWLTASDVRDYLIKTGFDLRRYKANPLAAINTTLKRMVPAYLENKTSDTSRLYRRRLTLLEDIAASENVLAANFARLSSELAKRK
jgi:hypothetical protein